MQRSEPLLTIAIPTYNRRDDLEACLNSIKASWMEEFAGKVELVISSNASTDETDALVGKFYITGLRIIYERQSENLGPVRNFLRIVELATGFSAGFFQMTMQFTHKVCAKFLGCWKRMHQLMVFSRNSHRENMICLNLLRAEPASRVNNKVLSAPYLRHCN